MRIIKTSALRKFWSAHPEAEAPLRNWVAQTKAARWANFPDVRGTFPSADLAIMASRRTVVIFNIAHNRYRLIAAVHFNTRIVFTLMMLGHKEYDRNAWKERL